jgi:hypothetical protein
MTVKICFVCDDPIVAGEPRLLVANVLIHEYCAVEHGGVFCDTPECMYRWTAHGGACIL